MVIGVGDILIDRRHGDGEEKYIVNNITDDTTELTLDGRLISLGSGMLHNFLFSEYSNVIIVKHSNIKPIKYIKKHIL